MATPAGASTSASASFTPASVSTLAAGTATTAATTAARQLIRTKVSLGRCKDTCRINVRITNISRKYLYRVKLNARLSVNGRSVGSCYDYVGTIKPRKVRYAACTVRTRALSQKWNNYLDGWASFNRYARTSVAYRYYR
ncbi:hypothetical protein [Nonomuraea fuscirosea]|uniref:hypothetical protein n=1 Tax=Nonomuraea fuscirosea TaxID=1291556 RepID=UPI00344817E9